MTKKQRKPKRRVDGEGSIYKLPSGRWRAAISTGERTASGRPRKITRTCRTRADALAALEELRADHRSGRTVATGQMTVEMLLRQWLTEEVEGNLAPGTVFSYSNPVNKQIIPRIGSVSLRNFAARHVRAMIASMRRDGVGGRTIQHTYDVLNHATKAAVAIGQLGSNPCTPVRRPRHEPRKIVPLTQDESKAVLRVAEGSLLHPILVIALTTGMRISEVLGLKWENVDLTGMQLHVRLQVYRKPDNSLGLKTPKTKRSLRVVRISETARRAFVDQRALLMRSGLGAGEMVFCRSDGRLLDRNAISGRWQKLLESVGLSHRGMHNLRHTFATLALTAGEPVHVVSQMLGHSSPSVTWSTYSHVLPGSQDQVAATLDRLFG